MIDDILEDESRLRAEFARDYARAENARAERWDMVRLVVALAGVVGLAAVCIWIGGGR